MRFRHIIFVLISIVALFGCRDEKIKSLSDLKSDQKDNIERLIKENNWKVKELKEAKLPSTIDPEVYYHFPNGLYMKVIDAGTKDKTEKDKTYIHLYAKGYISQKANTFYGRFNSISDPAFMPIEFIYTEFYNQGYIHYRTVPQIINGGNISDIMCEGFAYPMSLLGNNAKVSLIIPFELGPGFTYSNGATLVVENARYEFKDEENK